MKIALSADEYVSVEKTESGLEWRFYNCLTAREWSGALAGRDHRAAFSAAMRARGLPLDQEVILTGPIPRISIYLPANHTFARRQPKSGAALPRETQNAQLPHQL